MAFEANTSISLHDNGHSKNKCPSVSLISQQKVQLRSIFVSRIPHLRRLLWLAAFHKSFQAWTATLWGTSLVSLTLLFFFSVFFIIWTDLEQISNNIFLFFLTNLQHNVPIFQKKIEHIFFLFSNSIFSFFFSWKFWFFFEQI